MKILEVAGAIGKEDTIPRGLTGPSAPIALTRVAFLDNLRYLMVVFVLVYHSFGAYATVAPHWVVHDTSSFAADIIRELFDVFMMPVLFFVAGYFALASLEKKGAWIKEGTLVQMQLNPALIQFWNLRQSKVPIRPPT
jgi:hypothetical protein